MTAEASIPTEPVDLAPRAVYGDLAVASGRAQMKAKGKEGPEEFSYDSFNVFRRENGVWRYAAAFTP